MDAAVPKRGDQELGGAPEGLDALTVAERLKSDGGVAVTMMRVADHVPPRWPAAGGLHLDVSVTDLEPAVAAAVELGAAQADHQAQPDRWRVLLDPAGHPFCLTTVGAD